MKLTSLLTASVALLAMASTVHGAEQPTPAAPSTQSNATHQTGSASIGTSPEPADDDLCWESPEWRGDTPDSQLTHVPHE